MYIILYSVYITSKYIKDILQAPEPLWRALWHKARANAWCIFRMAMCSVNFHLLLHTSTYFNLNLQRYPKVKIIRNFRSFQLAPVSWSCHQLRLLESMRVSYCFRMVPLRSLSTGHIHCDIVAAEKGTILC